MAIEQLDLWQAGGARAIGSAHRRLNVPNQDALLAAPLCQRSPQTVVAVSDGHGWAASYRSDMGAHLAVRAARDVLDGFLKSAQAAPPPDELARAVVENWQHRVKRHVQTSPLPADSASDLYTAYGATLIAAGITQNQIVMLQIGDGDLLLGYSGGHISRPMPRDEALWGDETYSLCSANAHHRARVHILARKQGDAWPNFIFLSTDGVAKSTPAPGALEALCRSYHASAARNFEQTCAKAPLWLDAAGYEDDAAVCFAARGAR